MTDIKNIAIGVGLGLLGFLAYEKYIKNKNDIKQENDIDALKVSTLTKQPKVQDPITVQKKSLTPQAQNPGKGNKI